MSQATRTMTDNREKEWRFTGWHMLGVMVLFFGVIISVNVFMAWSAIRSWTGLEVANSYVASQEFDDKLAAANAQAALNLQIDLTYQAGELIFSLRDAEGVVLDASNVMIALTRPIGVSEDRTLELVRQGDFYVVSDALPDGVWNVEISADLADLPPFHHRARLTVSR